MGFDDVTCLILAGGASRRMGRDKAFIQIEGIRLLDYVYSTCQKLFNEIIIVTNQPDQFQEYHTPIVQDEIIGAGSIGGLYTGLKRATNYYSFCVACDMPFLNTTLITYIIEKRLNNDIVIPRTRAGFEPLHALYSKRCIEPLEKYIEKGELKITNLLEQVTVQYCTEEEIKRIDPALISFMNVNTDKELSKIQQMVKGIPWTEKQEAC